MFPLVEDVKCASRNKVWHGQGTPVIRRPHSIAQLQDLGYIGAGPAAAAGAAPWLQPALGRGRLNPVARRHQHQSLEPRGVSPSPN